MPRQGFEWSENKFKYSLLHLSLSSDYLIHFVHLPILRKFFAVIDSWEIVICTTSYESHTFFHEFVDQANM
jgi:hypothetical protein